MNNDLLSLSKLLEQKKIRNACFDWTAEHGDSLFSCLKQYECYKAAVAIFLKTHRPNFEFGLGSYGEVFVYADGKIEIFYNKRIIAEESDHLVFQRLMCP